MELPDMGLAPCSVLPAVDPERWRRNVASAGFERRILKRAGSSRSIQDGVDVSSSESWMGGVRDINLSRVQCVNGPIVQHYMAGISAKDFLASLLSVSDPNAPRMEETGATVHV